MAKIFAVFSGQGAQSVGMGKDLYEHSAAARACFDRAAAVLGEDFLRIVFEGPAEDLTATENCQPAIYVTSCAALAAYRELHGDAFLADVVACAGLSLGEYAALYAAGAFDFETGLKLLSARARLMAQACRKYPGGMASVLKADPAVIAECCRAADIDVANYNSPGQIVISGPKDKLERAVALLKERGVTRVIVLNVAGAFHSRLMREAGEEFAGVLAQSPIAAPRIPVYHNYTGGVSRDPAEIRDLLAKQVSGSVRWEDSLRRAVAAGADTVWEFGPGNVLTGLAKRTIPTLALRNFNTMESVTPEN